MEVISLSGISPPEERSLVHGEVGCRATETAVSDKTPSVRNRRNDLRELADSDSIVIDGELWTDITDECFDPDTGTLNI